MVDALMEGIYISWLLKHRVSLFDNFYEIYIYPAALH